MQLTTSIKNAFIPMILIIFSMLLSFWIIGTWTQNQYREILDLISSLQHELCTLLAKTLYLR